MFNSQARLDINIPTASYWLAKSSYIIEDEFCPTDNDRALTLWHLKQFDMKVFSSLFPKQNKTVKDAVKNIKNIFPQTKESDLINQAAATHDLSVGTVLAPASLENENRMLLESQIMLIMNFIEVIEIDDNKITRIKLGIGVLIVLLLAATTGILFAYAIPLAQQENYVTHHLFYDEFNGTTCVKISGDAGDPCNSFSLVIEFCKDLCDQYPDFVAECGYLIGAIIGLAATGLTAMGLCMEGIYDNRFDLASDKAKELARIGFGSEAVPVAFFGTDHKAYIYKIVKATKVALSIRQNEHEKLLKPAVMTITVVDEDSDDEKEENSEEKNAANEAYQLVMNSPPDRYNSMHSLWKRTPSSFNDAVAPLLGIDDEADDEASFTRANSL